MEITLINPDKFLRPTHRKQEISPETITNFKQQLNTFLANIHEPSREGKQETDLRDFLNDALYKGKFYINKKETIDWAIHNGMDAKSKVAVLIEVKKTAEKTDMFTEEKPNVKALHELILYYLRERIEHNNHEIRYLIATNCHEWYFFNELWFNENIFTTKLKKTYQDWKLSGHGTDDFYKLHAKSYLENLETSLEFCKVDIRDYTKASDKKLSELYKILSPEHLLKQEIANDANKLNKPFYNELLYLIGIEERKDDKSNKKIIERLLPAHRKEGSLLENTIEQLDTKNALAKVPNLESYGDTEEEQKYSVALELCITWLNRLLFLKLLEGQLIKYHNGDRKYRFLTSDRINDFDELGELFFGVLAKRPTERKPSVQQKFGDIPYLNSSLFEETVLESSVLSVEILKDRLELSLFGNTVLKDTNGKTRKGEVKTLKYLLDFLDSYDFGSKDEKETAAAKNTEAVNHDRTINAAVLGLIFEKLNGYKDGSFFTPSFITMYMCRETLRRAVVQKFNEAQSLNCQDFAELKDHLDDDYKKPEKRKSYNDLLNSIRICDPAVGSGHFLVSALNEMIAIKAELKILQHPNGTRLKGYEISIENDELIVWEEDTQKDFQYKIGQAGKPFQELQIIQETLFHEKRTIIENCLFGVDINPKSVSICQLRLWIELLKNAFYTPESNYLYLETLPNIDINIKTGNSLVSKYSLTEDLSEVFKKQKFSIEAYRTSVHAYKEANSKTAKADLQRFINEIKEQFKETVKNTDPRRRKLSELRGKRTLLDLNVDMFGNKSLNDDQLDLQKRKFDKLILELDSEITDVANAKIYRNSFEWRFEFPEVLNENGDFVGFDVVVGNPPYGVKQNDSFKTFFNNNYQSSSDIFTMFIEKGLDLVAPKSTIGYIIPVSWLTGENYVSIRSTLMNRGNLDTAINLPYNVFEEAFVDTGIYIFTNNNSKNYTSKVFEFQPKTKIGNDFINMMEFEPLSSSEWQSDKSLKIILNRNTINLQNKFHINSSILGDLCLSVRGILANDTDISDLKLSETYQPFFNGKLNRYISETPNLYVKYGDNLKEKPKNFKLFTGERILIRRIVSRQFRIMANLVEEDYVSKKDLYIFKTINDNYSPKYLLSLINSTLMSYLKTQGSTSAKKNDFTQLTLNDVRELPIKQISLENQTPFIEKVYQILTLKKADSNADTSELEAQIDRMVYDLYELTEEEILIVEGK